MESIIAERNFSNITKANTDAVPDTRSSFNKNYSARPRHSVTNRREQLSNKALDELFSNIVKTVRLQAEEWREMPFFQRQYIFESFKKVMGLSIDQFLMNFEKLSSMHEMNREDFLNSGEYEQHDGQESELLNLYEKDKLKTSVHSEFIKGWF